MASDDAPLDPAAELRRQAEARAFDRAGLAARHLDALLPEETRHMLHELRVHQIELELQNEELRRTSAELDVLRARYFDLYDLAPVGYCAIDDQGRIQQANLTVATLLGVSRAAMQSALLSRFIHPPDQDVWYLHRKRLMDTGGAVSFDLRLMRQESECFWARLEGTVGVEADGSRVIRLVLSDISERRRLEEAGAELAIKLEQSQRLESVGRLAGGVAHASNNMLGVIIGHSELALLQPDLSAALRLDFEQIREAAQRSARLTRQLLAFASQQVGRPQALDLGEVIEQEVHVLQGIIGPDVTLRVHSEPNLWSIWMDPSQVDQILTNLCLNSRDAMSAGGIIRIDLANCALTEEDCSGLADAIPGDYVRMTLSDDGRGMDAHTLAHLFEPFFTTKPNWEGTGLGLASVYGSVRQNRGFIWVTSEPGKGAKFAVHLPRFLGSGVSLSAQSAPEALARTADHETILVVEDDPALLQLTERVLLQAGYTVLTAGTPADAIRIITQYPTAIHLLLSDVVMPEMNGRDLAARSLAIRPGMRCLFMSGFAPDGPADLRARTEGFGFLQKPLSISNLTMGVRRALDAPQH